MTPGPGAPVGALRGLWRRSLIVLPDGRRDAETWVGWLQGASFFADLRQPSVRPDMSGVESVRDLSDRQIVWLATQEGFAGTLAADGDCIAWTRQLDFQPPSSSPDVAHAWFEGGQLIEAGRDVPYVEYWSRDVEPEPAACWGASLRNAEDARAWIVRAGARFMFMRARAAPLTTDARLSDLVREEASLTERQALVDCEVSFGTVAAEGWRIDRSTLPFREGAAIRVAASDSVMHLDGAAWRIEAIEGDVLSG